MKTLSNFVIEGRHGKPVLTDILYQENTVRKPLVIFSHGFKGFKDWGQFNLVADAFARAGFVFAKFNFSHNGTTPQQPDEITDTDAFGKNNFQIELDDLGCVIDFLLNEPIIPDTEIDKDKLYLLGHSRGGGISLIKARDDKRVKKVAVWASVNEFGKFWTAEIMAQWKRDGVLYVPNTRTGQLLPLYYSSYEKMYANKDKYGIENAVRQLHIPILIVHGTNDATVSYSDAVEMCRWNKNARLLTIENSDHVFGGKHPWNESVLPADTLKALEGTISFFRSAT
jgi:pimeloyl-ACP methyl ester carboxylesterase